MDDEARRLVDDQQMRVLVHHVERDILGRVMGGLGLRHFEPEDLVAANLARRIVDDGSAAGQRSARISALSRSRDSAGTQARARGRAASRNAPAQA
jgi:hypothetical protein